MKKRILSLAVALMMAIAVFTPFAVTVQAAESYTVVVPYQFEDASSFYEGLGRVVKGGKMGYLDRTGNVVIPFEFSESLSYFSEGLTLVVKDDKWGFIDKTGKLVIPYQFEYISYDFSEGLAVVGVGIFDDNKKDQFGFIDKTGSIVIPYQFDDAFRFTEGLAAVGKGDKWGYIDQSGKVVIPFEFDDAFGFYEGLAAVQKGNMEGYIDKQGNVVIPYQYDGASYFNEGLATVRNGDSRGMIDKTGKLVVSYQAVDSMSYIDTGLLVVKKNDKYGLMDFAGNMITPFQFDDLYPRTFGQEEPLVVRKGDKFGFIDKTGELVIPYEFDGAFKFSDGLAPVKKGDKWGYISYNTPAPAPTPAPATASTWAVPEISKAEQLGLVPDSLKGANVDLTKPITRVEFAGVAIKVYENLTATAALPATTNPFADTKDLDALKAYNTGIMVGYSATHFEPNIQLNREQCATALTRVFKRATIPGWTIDADESFPLAFTRTAPFTDDAQISGWAKESVYFMSSHAIIAGMGNNMFVPRNVTNDQEARGYATATREQALAIAVRMVENLKN